MDFVLRIIDKQYVNGFIFTFDWTRLLELTRVFSVFVWATCGSSTLMLAKWWAFSIYRKIPEISLGNFHRWGTCSIWHKFHSFPGDCRRSCHFSLPKMWPWRITRVKGLELVKPHETRKWNTHFPSEGFQRENGTTFSDAPFIPEIFQWNVPKKCVPFTSQPEFPESLGKWKTPGVSVRNITWSPIRIEMIHVLPTIVIFAGGRFARVLRDLAGRFLRFSSQLVRKIRLFMI